LYYLCLSFPDLNEISPDLEEGRLYLKRALLTHEGDMGGKLNKVKIEKDAHRYLEKLD
jgi:hypothetical protein